MAGLNRVAAAPNDGAKTVQGPFQTKGNLRSSASGTPESSRVMKQGMMHKASEAAWQLPRGVSS